ncbi:M13 family metallopeptidase [Longimicrobium sp.]|uniref:M13 family metallopeptidase n=1 Tax=Longimicrobium sp. TaxID=2029185 RepID=UPI002D7EC029|nr:M13 family metallopeptidase [Longimicrobium sp.]
MSMPNPNPTRRRALALALVAASALAAQAARAQVPATQLAPLKVVDPAMVDTTVKACSNFFQFATGSWLKNDTIPAAYSSSGVGRDMQERNELVVRAVLDDAARRRATLPAGSTERKLGTYYASCMDSTTAERAGLDPVRPMLARIAAAQTRAAVLAQVAALQAEGVNMLFRYAPDVAPHDAAHYLAQFYAGGLGLPDRDYYTNQGASADSLRRAYVDHVARLFVLAGTPEAEARADAQRVMALETEMAKASLTRVARREPSATDHPMTLAQLRSITPSVNWTAYFAGIGLTRPVANVNVAEPAFMRRVSELLATVPVRDWRAYLRYHVLSDAAPWLSTPFVQENFAFSSRFTGARQLLPRWKRCLRATDADMGEALGQAYVQRTFPPEARAKARQVIDDIRDAFAARLRNLGWMSEATRTQALAKLAQMGEKVGYPEQWRDYARLQVAEGPFVLNSFAANRFEWQRRVNRPGMPVDTTEWDMTVPTVNAYYDPTKNEMVFPAGALVPQTFDPNADDAANYGSLGGSWAGHELTHGFDDEGRHYDARGNLRDWWTAADSAHFAQQADLMAAQYGGYIQVDTFHVNGRLTMGENIADYGGALTAFDALQRALERHGRPGLIDGFTPEQRFFLAYAQSFRQHNRPESLRNRVTVDPHSPEEWRVNGPLSNMPQFAQAFGCKPGDAMVRPASAVAQIW